MLLAWRSALGEGEVADRQRLQAADDDEAAEVAAVVGDVVIPLGDVRGRRGREDPELLELLLVLGENPAREMCRRRRGEVRTPETNAATLSSATKQWFRPQMPHMPVRDDECAIVMSGRVSASPGRINVSYDTMSRPAGSKINADEASAMSVMACFTRPPFALAARVLPRVTAIVQRLASRL